METKLKADALVDKHRRYADAGELDNETETLNGTECAILSVEYTIEVLSKVITHDKERYGITSRGATIELDKQTELLIELKSRIV